MIVPLLIAGAYGAYNYGRFGNPLEFGQSYLPEFVNAGEPMLSLTRIWRNLGYCLRLPTVQAGALAMPTVSGFAAYLTNPLFDFALLRGGEAVIKKKMDAQDWFLAASIAIHAALLLTHRTNGGWQYGTRYWCDCVPALVYAFARQGGPVRRFEAAAMGMLAVFNLLAIAAFHGL